MKKKSAPPKNRSRQRDPDDLEIPSYRYQAKRQYVQKTNPRKGQRNEITESAANATVTAAFPKQCRVLRDGSGKEILAVYRRAQLIDPEKEKRERSPLTVGDRVYLDNQQTITGIAKRKNELVRPAPGKGDSDQIHVIAANLDAVVVISACSEPHFSETLIDRYWIASIRAEIPLILVLTKTDELPSALETSSGKKWLDFYAELGVPTFLTSSKIPETLAPLKRALHNKRVAFCGHSGVGKTSLLSALLGYSIGKILDLAETTGKGQHSTTTSILHRGPDQSEWIDTPGIREFGLVDITPETLIEYFPDLQRGECTIPHCLHLDKSSLLCKVHTLKRWPSYIRIYQSLVDAQLGK